MNAKSLFTLSSLVVVMLVSAPRAFGVTPDPVTPPPPAAAADDGCTKYTINPTTNEKTCTDACQSATDAARTAEQDADTASQALLEAQTNVTKGLGEQQKAASDLAAAAAAAQIAYNAKTSEIQKMLPSDIEAVKNAGQMQALELQGKLAELDQKYADAAAALAKAKSDIVDAQVKQQSDCVKFAGKMANAALAKDNAKWDAIKAQIAAGKAYQNNAGTSLASSTNRTRAQHALLAQNAYANSYKACMSGSAYVADGATDEGPGPDMQTAIAAMQNALPAAQTAYDNAVKALDKQRDLLKQQLALTLKNVNDNVTKLIASKQVEADNALAVFQTTMTQAQNASNKANIDYQTAQAIASQQAPSLSNRAMNSSLSACRASSAAQTACYKVAANPAACAGGMNSNMSSQLPGMINNLIPNKSSGAR